MLSIQILVLKVQVCHDQFYKIYAFAPLADFLGLIWDFETINFFHGSILGAKILVKDEEGMNPSFSPPSNLYRLSRALILLNIIWTKKCLRHGGQSIITFELLKFSVNWGFSWDFHIYLNSLPVNLKIVRVRSASYI